MYQDVIKYMNTIFYTDITYQLNSLFNYWYI